MKSINILELNGYIYLKDDEVFLEDSPLKLGEEYHYPEVESIGSQVKEYFSKLLEPIIVDYSDWTEGDYSTYKDVFCRYFISEKEINWEEAKEEHIKYIVGDIETQKMFDGYSEWTIMDSWVELFIGGHDLRKELSQYKGKYAIIRIESKTLK